MQRTSFPAAETTVSRIKSLVLALDRRKTRAHGDDVLAAVHLTRGDLDNETRPIGVSVWHAALAFVADRHGKDFLPETWCGVVEPENMGVWSRVLRGTSEPGGAFRQLDGLGGDEHKTTHWVTLDDRPGMWRGRVSLRHDPRYEIDGLLHLARVAELRAIPVMYGLEPADVETVSQERATFASQTGAAGQEFRVTWRAARKRQFLPLGGVIGGAIGLGAAIVSPTAGLVLGVGGALAGVGVGLLLRHEQRRRTEEHAQAMRLRALERASFLRDRSAEAKSAGNGREEGAVVAGMYRLGKSLGSGANGVVHAAEKLEGATPVAVKFLRAAVAHDPVAIDRLRREGEAMGLAWHPNVVELVDQGVLPDGSPYLVMEKLEGDTLADRIAAGGRLSPEELLPIALQLCDALGAVHAAGVVHRDVKPSNVYLTDALGELRTKLFDFGIARVEWAETRLTQAGAPVGTPGYMAPEQQRGQEVDGRADLHALGMLLLEALTGTPPALPSPDPSASESGVMRSAIPAAWRAIVERATAVLPRDRFADARQMREAIAAAQPESGAMLARKPVSGS